jgi:hypothetical protein
VARPLCESQPVEERLEPLNVFCDKILLGPT